MCRASIYPSTQICLLGSMQPAAARDTFVCLLTAATVQFVPSSSCRSSQASCLWPHASTYTARINPHTPTVQVVPLSDAVQLDWQPRREVAAAGVPKKLNCRQVCQCTSSTSTRECRGASDRECRSSSSSSSVHPSWQCLYCNAASCWWVWCAAW